MIEKLRQHFPNLFSGNLSSGVEIGLLIAVLAFLYFLFFVKKSYKNPFWGMLVIFLGGATFVGFFIGGIKIGNLFGFEDMGAFIGIFAFFGLAALYKHFTTPPDQRRKKF